MGDLIAGIKAVIWFHVWVKLFALRPSDKNMVRGDLERHSGKEHILVSSPLFY